MEESEAPAGPVSQVIVSGPAEADLADIWFHIAVDNVVAADDLIAEFESRFALLGSAPQIGHSRRDLAPGLRCFPVGNYLIIYLHRAGVLSIVRVLHAARDIRGLT